MLKEKWCSHEMEMVMQCILEYTLMYIEKKKERKKKSLDIYAVPYGSRYEPSSS